MCLSFSNISKEFQSTGPRSLQINKCTHIATGTYNFYNIADDLNLRRKTILSLYNTYPSGNIIVSFRHQEDIYVSITLHISEFVCCQQSEYVITAKINCNESDTPIPYKRLFTVMILF